MKVRTGFVSNSSTSSYTCDVCNDTYAERDAGIDDAGMVECKNGHTICESHMIKYKSFGDFASNVPLEEKLDFLKSTYKYEKKHHILAAMHPEEIEEEFDDNDYAYNMRYEMPSSVCPVCNFKELTDSDALAYLVKDGGKNKKSLLKEIKERFSNYEEFEKFLK